MIEPKIEKILIKYFNKSANSKEIVFLETWIENNENQKLFESFVETHFKINLGLVKNNDLLLKSNLSNKIRKQKSKKLFSYIGYAASFLIAISTAFFVFFNDVNENKTQHTQTLPGTNKAILTLEDGNKIALSKDKKVALKNVNSTGQELIYTNTTKNKNTEKIAYNYLTVPKGGEFFVQLSDSTKVWLNADSQLKYPANFMEGKNREVELVYGEAFFDVSHSSKHGGAKFIVINKMQHIEVLGTQFNVKAYNDEATITTTLVTGKILAKAEEKSALLTPNQQSIFNTQNKNYLVKNVNADLETSWKKGVFNFKNETLKEITKVLSRWYNVEVVFENKELENIQFKGVLNRDKKLEDILLLIKKTHFINDFEINKNTLTIK